MLSCLLRRSISLVWTISVIQTEINSCGKRCSDNEGSIVIRKLCGASIIREYSTPLPCVQVPSERLLGHPSAEEKNHTGERSANISETKIGAKKKCTRVCSVSTKWGERSPISC